MGDWEDGIARTYPTVTRYPADDRVAGRLTAVTESFSHEPYSGFQGFLYGTLFRRSAAMVKGMQQTLAGVKAELEASD